VPRPTQVHRGFNIDIHTVEDFYGSIWEAKAGQILQDGEVIFSEGVRTPSAISIIGDMVYFQSDRGLERFDMFIQEREPMYYDNMVWAIAGLTTIYYVTGDLHLRVITADLRSETIGRVTEDTEFAVVDHLLYIRGSAIIIGEEVLTELIIDLEDFM
jgi:hypothetical protein